VCLGAEAKAANKAAKRQYEYQLKVREQNWMNSLNLTKVERLQHDQNVTAANVGLGDAYSQIQEKFRDEIGAALQEDETNWKQFLHESTGSEMAAAGQTGKSAERIASRDFAGYLAKGSRKAYELTNTARDLSREGAKAAGAARHAQMQSFAKNFIIKNPELAPPKPVYKDVGAASFMDALSIGSSIMGIVSGGVGTAQNISLMTGGSSDRRLKENIKKIGESLSGLGIYKFNYIGKAKKYIGAMADEVLKVVPEAAILADDGFYRVNYSLIDVDFREATV